LIIFEEQMLVLQDKLHFLSRNIFRRCDVCVGDEVSTLKLLCEIK